MKMLHEILILLIFNNCYCVDDISSKNITIVNNADQEDSGEHNETAFESAGVNVNRTSFQLEEISSLVSELVLSQAFSPISFRVEPPVSPFIGRVSLLSELKYILIDKKIAVLTGIKGIGKSELARKYSQEFRHDNISSTIWIDSYSYTTIIDSFKDLSLTIGITPTNKKIPTLIREVITFFSSRKTLFIFDNAEPENILINSIPIYIGNSKFISTIITSRQVEWDHPKFKVTPVDPFTPEESYEFLRLNLHKQLNRVAINQSCTALAEKLGHLPLALHEAVIHIVQQNVLYPNRNYTITHYIDQLNEPTDPPVETDKKEINEHEWNRILIDKIEEESKRLGGKLSKGAKDVGRAVCRGAVNAQRELRKILGFTVNTNNKKTPREQCQ